MATPPGRICGKVAQAGIDAAQGNLKPWPGAESPGHSPGHRPDQLDMGFSNV